MFAKLHQIPLNWKSIGPSPFRDFFFPPVSRKASESFCFSYIFAQHNLFQSQK